LNLGTWSLKRETIAARFPMSKTLGYGRGSVTVELPAPNCRAVVQPTLPPPISDLDAAIEKCLNDPVGGKPLANIVEGRHKVVVVIPDTTRGEAMQAYLPPLLHYIERHHVRREHVTILTATGAHRRHSDDEREALVGADVARDWVVADHDADEGNVEIEPLDDETPLWIDHRAVEADCLILAGLVSYHYCAGFGGGRKLIAPGLCGRATVQALHRRTLGNIDPAGNWRGHTGGLRGNPFHEALQAVAERVGPDFCLNITLGGERKIIGIVAGDFVQSHQVACLQYAKTFNFPIPERLPLVVASCGGWPYDINLYQAHKALDNAFRATQPGGTIVLLAECSEGWGPESFIKWMAIGSLEEHRARLASHFEVAGHTTYALKWKASQCRVIVVSEALAQSVRAGNAVDWLSGEGGTAPFRIEIVGDVNEAMAKADPRRSLPYYIMPAAVSCLPEVTG
jgi:nickel-dependent lactate racemase